MGSPQTPVKKSGVPYIMTTSRKTGPKRKTYRPKLGTIDENAAYAKNRLDSQKIVMRNRFEKYQAALDKKVAAARRSRLAKQKKTSVASIVRSWFA